MKGVIAQHTIISCHEANVQMIRATATAISRFRWTLFNAALLAPANVVGSMVISSPAVVAVQSLLWLPLCFSFLVSRRTQHKEAIEHLRCPPLHSTPSSFHVRVPPGRSKLGP